MEIRKMSTSINIPGFTRLYDGEIIVLRKDVMVVIDEAGTGSEELINTFERSEIIKTNSEQLYKEKVKYGEIV